MTESYHCLCVVDAQAADVLRHRKRHLQVSSVISLGHTAVSVTGQYHKITRNGADPCAVYVRLRVVYGPGLEAYNSLTV